MSCSSWHLRTSGGRSRIAHGMWPAWSAPAHAKGRRMSSAVRCCREATRAARLPWLVQGTQGSLEFGGNLVQGWGNGRWVSRLKQLLHASTRTSYCISQDAGPSSAGVVRGRRLEYGQPILDSGYAIRADGPAARDLIKRARLTQLRDEHSGKPRHLLLGRCKISPPDSSTVCPHEKGRRYRGGKQ
jgi:hypothetical protein